jgi:hypothetical protein
VTTARVVILLLVAGAVTGAVVLLSGPAEPDDLPEAPPRFRIFDVDEKPVAGASVTLHVTADWEIGPRAGVEFASREDGGVVCDAPALKDGMAEWAVIRKEGQPRITVPIAEVEGEIYLPAGRPVRGRVLDLRGRPISGARVTTPPLPPYAVETVADAEGRYDLGIISEDAWIRASADGVAVLDLCLSLYPLDMEEAVFLLAPGYTISGRVVTGSGEPVPGALVELEQESVTRLIAAPDGTFSFPGVLPNWEAVFTARKPGLLGPTVTALSGERNVEIRLHRPATVSGIVVDGETGEPVPRFEIARKEYRDRFAIGNLMPGPVLLEARAGHRVGEAEITVEAGDELKDLRIPVFLRQWGDPEDGRPGAAFEVRVFEEDRPLAEARVRYDGFDQKGRTDENGLFRIRLAPGEHVLLVGGDLETHAEREVVVTVPDDENAVVRLERNPRVSLLLEGEILAGENVIYLRTDAQERLGSFIGERYDFPVDPTVSLDLYVAAKGCLPVFRRGLAIPGDGRIRIAPPKGAFVTGRCVGESGDPLPKVVAELLELPPESREETLGDGRFRIGPVHPGHYRVQLTGRNVRTFKKAITVTEEGFELGTVKLLSPADLLIRVTTSDGAPVARAEVRTTYRVEARGMTDPAGRITLPGTEPAEMLRVRATGLLDGWQDVRLPDESYREEIQVVMFRPARIVVRAVDPADRPVHLLEPLEAEVNVMQLRSDQLLLTDVPPGPLTLDLTDRDGRKGTLELTVTEGEERMVKVVVR